MALDIESMNAELEGILEAISYEVTTARTSGLGQPEKLRASLRRARGLIADADSLASHVAAERAESREA